MKNARVIATAMALIVAFGLLSYFVHPKAPQLELVTPEQELASFRPRYPGDMSLSNRVMKSYDLAFILVRSPFLATNINALEAIREWAKDEFQSHPDFLHPVSLPAAVQGQDTIFGALGQNVFAAPRYFLEFYIGELLKSQIQRFHGTVEYRSFNSAFFDIFGKDADAATLLARFESNRAKQAVDVLLWVLLWSTGAVVGLGALIVSRNREFFNAVRKVTAGAWCLMCVAYLTQAWSTGHAASLLSMLICAAIAFYLFRPFVLASHREAKQQIVRIHLAPCWIATAAWFTFTCLAVQLLTWMRSGIPAAPDPVSLFLASLCGNFLHELIAAKRFLTGSIACLWLVISAWALMQRHKDQPSYQEPDSNFQTLDRARALDSVR